MPKTSRLVEAERYHTLGAAQTRVRRILGIHAARKRLFWRKTPAKKTPQTTLAEFSWGVRRIRGAAEKYFCGRGRGTDGGSRLLRDDPTPGYPSPTPAANGAGVSSTAWMKSRGRPVVEVLGAAYPAQRGDAGGKLAAWSSLAA